MFAPFLSAVAPAGLKRQLSDRKLSKKINKPQKILITMNKVTRRCFMAQKKTKQKEHHSSEAAKVVGGVMCCKTVILWLSRHGNSVSWVSHVSVLHVIPVAAHWRAQGKAGRRRRGGPPHACHHFNSPMRIKQAAVVSF